MNTTAHASATNVDTQFDFNSTKPDQFRRVHKLTLVIRFWGFIAAGLFIFLTKADATLIHLSQVVLNSEKNTLAWEAFAVLAGMALITGLLFLVSLVWWRATGFRLTHDEIQMRRGVISLKLTTARYDRIQAVDLAEPFLARIFGLASVKVQTAGGKDSSISIEYLRKSEAEKVQQEILALHTDSSELSVPESSITPNDAQDPNDAAETLIPEIPVSRSLTSALWNFGTVALVCVLCVFALGAAISNEALFRDLAAAYLLPAVIGVGLAFWGFLDRSYRFTATVSEDVLKITYGLANKQKQSIPLERIHGIKLTQSFLWRLCGWWQVHISVAGYGEKVSSNRTTTTVLPVGSRKQALHMLEVLGPIDHETITQRAQPEGHSRADFTSPIRAKWISPLDRKKQGVTLISGASGELQGVVTHWGRLKRSMAVIDPSHIQELTMVNGPVQQLLKLTTIRFDLIQGPVRMSGRDLDPAQGEQLLNLLRSRSLPALDRSEG